MPTATKCDAMKRVKRLFFVAASAACSLTALAEGIDGELRADLVSGYIWRGQNNAGISVQPTAAISWRGLRLGAWGSYELSGKHDTGRELDLTLSYTVKGFSVGVTDYFIGADSPYFHYCAHSTRHTFEATVGYDFGFMAVNWSTNFLGLDGRNPWNGKRAYSSYLQLSAPFHLGPFDWTATVGMVPWSTDFYAADHSRHFHVNTVSLQAGYTVKCGAKFELPVYANVCANPSSNSMFFFIGCTLTAF